MSGRRRPRVKICGLTSPRDAELAVTLGADFLGLNFYPLSPRYVDPRRAGEIAKAVAGRSRLVGVFVDSPQEEIAERIATVGLDLVQFHGDEPPRDVLPFAERAIKVLRVEEDFDNARFDDYPGIWGFLLDTHHPELRGGTGSSWNFASLGGSNATRLVPRVFIAGGLAPENVRVAIAAAQPYGIDLCSGIEEQPGKKDPHRMRRLFEEIENVQITQPA